MADAGIGAEVWTGRTSRTVIAAQAILTLVIFGIIAGYLRGLDTFTYTSNGVEKTLSGTTIGYCVIGVGVLIALGSAISALVKVFTITDRAITIKSGILSLSTRSIYFDQIKDVNLSRGIFERLLGAGSVQIDTGRVETTIREVSTGDNTTRPVSDTHTVYDSIASIADYQTVNDQLQTTLQKYKSGLYSGRLDQENLAK